MTPPDESKQRDKLAKVKNKIVLPIVVEEQSKIQLTDFVNFTGPTKTLGFFKTQRNRPYGSMVLNFFSMKNSQFSSTPKTKCLSSVILSG